ncbi:hypothetical protein CHS0354_026303 [Potamilus streckersoni]|uniref:Uncharacterized protein n=1 Tax=Potamilus streckersoni TaxID=2493646 RepID=A0AAE0WA60_9BIVA|nr:hypothetical protein CHS0354_026303 [Potamilus streckersoni]
MEYIRLADDNPNITDLSDQNRPDKLAEQFSELYTNQWTDCYQVLIDNYAKQQEESISILLRILIYCRHKKPDNERKYHK